MRWLKWTIRAGIAFFVLAFLHYTLAQRDIVRITSTEVLRVDLSGWNRLFYTGGDSGNSANATRDLRLINAVYPNGKVIVYRNEDTGWFAWPPYFKTNSSDITAQAENYKSDGVTPKWVAITHYGWRFSPLSIYPNVLKIRPVATSDVRLFPWFNVIVLVSLGLLALGFYRLCQLFWRRIMHRLAQWRGI